eukprot:1175815-Prorocentrum_minimum.AAC.4
MGAVTLVELGFLALEPLESRLGAVPDLDTGFQIWGGTPDTVQICGGTPATSAASSSRLPWDGTPSARSDGRADVSPGPSVRSAATWQPYSGDATAAERAERQVSPSERQVSPSPTTRLPPPLAPSPQGRAY